VWSVAGYEGSENLQVDNATPQSDRDCFGSITRLELRKNVSDVHLDVSSAIESSAAISLFRFPAEIKDSTSISRELIISPEMCSARVWAMAAGSRFFPA